MEACLFCVQSAVSDIPRAERISECTNLLPALQAGQRSQGTGADEGLQESSNEGCDDEESDISSLTASHTNIAKLVRDSLGALTSRHHTSFAPHSSSADFVGW